MSQEKNDAIINTFAEYKCEFNDMLKRLHVLSEQNFNLDQQTLTQNHCLELWYHTRLLEDMSLNAFTHNAPNTES